MEIAQEDIYVEMMKQELCKISLQMRNNFEQIKNVSSENTFLFDVLSDYNQYYDYIKDQKKKQHEALRKLMLYIEIMSQELETTEYLLRETKRDQSDIIKEITNVKSEIQELMIEK